MRLKKRTNVKPILNFVSELNAAFDEAYNEYGDGLSRNFVLRAWLNAEDPGDMPTKEDQDYALENYTD